jgi:light-regulated signal transduction histidine kinase (bacteriophytochrome)
MALAVSVVACSSSGDDEPSTKEKELSASRRRAQSLYEKSIDETYAGYKRSVTERMTRRSFTIEVKPRDAHVHFVVRDTGPGIPEKDLKNVFTPYWQAKKTAHMGAGLGLAIVRGIVAAHKGQIWAENAAGGGAMFTFTIPVA